MLERTRITERYARGFAAAVVAAATLILAAHTGPGGATEPVPQTAQYVGVARSS